MPAMSEIDIEAPDLLSFDNLRRGLEPTSIASFAMYKCCLKRMEACVRNSAC
jgi:hypothetical protein